MNNLTSNYITSAWRNILRHKLFSIINILGLAIGLAAVMLIALYVRYETSYDSFWKNADNIYRVQITFNAPGQDIVKTQKAPAPVIVAMKKDFAEIKNYARIDKNSSTITINEKIFFDEISVVDRNVNSIFDFDFIAGESESSLVDKYGIILTKSRALKYFEKINPIGEILTIEYGPVKRDYKVTGVIEDIPKSSNLDIQAMVLLAPEDWGNSAYVTGWFTSRFQTYFTLNDNVKINNISTKLPDFIDRNFPSLPFGDGSLNQSEVIKLPIMNIKELHLKAEGVGGVKPTEKLSTVVIFSVVAILILIIACINFMNLSTARATERAKEIGLRKTLGANRKNLIFQFISESVLITFFGLLIAFALVEITLPIYNDILTKELVFLYSPLNLIVSFFFAFLIGIGGGIYPALVLSKLRPSEVLKSNQSSSSTDTLKFRSIMVIIQFTVSTTLFVSTAVIYNQMRYVHNLNLGYNSNNLLTFYGNNTNELGNKINIIQQRLKKLENVKNVTWSRYFYPGVDFSSGDALRTEDSSEYKFGITSSRAVGYDFFNTYQIPLIAGRSFDRNRNDTIASKKAISDREGHVGAIIVNQSALGHLNLGTPSEAIGKKIYMNYGQVSGNKGNGNIEAEALVIGVTSDVHFKTLKSVIGPEFYFLSPDVLTYVTLRYSDNPIQLMDQVKTIWQEELQTTSLGFSFSTDALAEQYLQETGQMTMFAAFSGLAIFIACLGLFGLASFTAERRTKEIGIRKIFGAEVFQIVKLLVWQFSKPVLIANIIAWPIAYLAMSRWLESFVYRIDDMVIIALCLVAGLTALLIAWATVAGNSYAVARQNPIKALKYE